MRWAVVVVALAGGIYELHWLHNGNLGAGLIGFAGLLTDPGVVLDAIKAWRGSGPQPPRTGGMGVEG